jgi:hypothetical protein
MWFARIHFFRTPRFNAAVINTPTAAPNAIHFPMLWVAAPIAAPIAMPTAIPMFITILHPSLPTIFVTSTT